MYLYFYLVVSSCCSLFTDLRRRRTADSSSPSPKQHKRTPEPLSPHLIFFPFLFFSTTSIQSPNSFLFVLRYLVRNLYFFHISFSFFKEGLLATPPKRFPIYFPRKFYLFSLRKKSLISLQPPSFPVLGTAQLIQLSFDFSPAVMMCIFDIDSSLVATTRSTVTGAHPLVGELRIVHTFDKSSAALYNSAG